MVYLARARKDGERIVYDLAACEDEAHAQAREREGYHRVMHDYFSSLWRQRDLSTIARLRPAPVPPPAVEEDAPYMLHFGGR